MPALVGGVHLLGLAALLLTAWFWLEPELGAWRLTGLIAAAAAVLFSWLRWRRLAAAGLASLDVGGQPPWRYRLKGQTQEHDLKVLAWTAVGPVIALDIESDRPQIKQRLLLTRDQMSPEQWRAVRAALQWLPRRSR